MSTEHKFVANEREKSHVLRVYRLPPSPFIFVRRQAA